MIDFLTAVTASVDDDAETVDGTFLHGQLSSQPKHFTQKSVVLRLGVSQRLNVLLGNDQEVHGSLRMDVLEGQYFIIFINFGGRTSNRQAACKPLEEESRSRAKDGIALISHPVIAFYWPGLHVAYHCQTKRLNYGGNYPSTPPTSV